MKWRLMFRKKRVVSLHMEINIYQAKDIKTNTSRTQLLNI